MLKVNGDVIAGGRLFGGGEFEPVVAVGHDQVRYSGRPTERAQILRSAKGVIRFVRIVSQSSDESRHEPTILKQFGNQRPAPMSLRRPRFSAPRKEPQTVLHDHASLKENLFRVTAVFGGGLHVEHIIASATGESSEQSTYRKTLI